MVPYQGFIDFYTINFGSLGRKTSFVVLHSSLILVQMPRLLILNDPHECFKISRLSQSLTIFKKHTI